MASIRTVYSFSHHHESKPANYLQICIGSLLKRPLAITSDHLVFLADKEIPVPASQIKMGDKPASDSKNTTITKTVVRDGL